MKLKKKTLKIHNNELNYNEQKNNNTPNKMKWKTRELTDDKRNRASESEREQKI